VARVCRCVINVFPIALPLTDLIVFLAKLNSAAVKITPRCFVSWMLWWREMFSQNNWVGYQYICICVYLKDVIINLHSHTRLILFFL